jgi:hypothetical protein
MTKTLNQIILFCSTKIRIFFQQHWESDYFFRKKTIPAPFKLNGRSLSTIDQTKPSIDTGIHKDRQIHDDRHFILEVRLQKCLPNCQICSGFVCVCYRVNVRENRRRNQK